MLEHVDVIPTWNLTEDEWRELRKTGLGGSDAATICGLNPYSSPYDLWAYRMGLTEGFTGNEATDWGHILETPVASMFAMTIQRPVLQWKVMLHSTKYPWMNANMDGLVLTGTDGEIIEWEKESLGQWESRVEAILEIKTTGMATPGKPYEWFEGDGIPDGYQLQGQWYMGVSGIHHVTYAALVAGHGLQVRELDFTEQIFSDLAEIGRQFWEDYVLTGAAPPVDGKDATEEALKEVYPRHKKDKVVEGGDELRRLWSALESAKIAEKEAIAERKELRNKIIQLLGDAEYGTVDGVPLCSFRASKDVESLTSDKLKKAQPALWKQFAKTRPGSRQLREVK